MHLPKVIIKANRLFQFIYVQKCSITFYSRCIRPSVMIEVSGIHSQCAKVNTSNHLHSTKPMADVLAQMNEDIYIQSKIQREAEHLFLIKKKEDSVYIILEKQKGLTHKPGSKTQMAGNMEQIIYQATVVDCLDGRNHLYQLACRQSKRKDRQSNVHLQKGAVLLSYM